jgi:hypothetical protein
MIFNSKQELVKESVKIAKEKYPKGFNKKQLIECSYDLNGGFSINQNKKINTLQDANHMRNHMVKIDGHYPASISDCFVIGINGDCGIDCPVFMSGKCGEPQEFDPENVILELGDEAISVMEFYSCFDEFLEERF